MSFSVNAPQPANYNRGGFRGGPGYGPRPGFGPRPNFGPRPGYGPGVGVGVHGRGFNVDVRVGGPFRPMPFRPMPYRPYPMPMPYYNPGVYAPGGYYGGPNALQQAWHGATEQLQVLFQYVAHPFNAYARQMPWDYYRPKTTAENVGKWLVNGAAAVGAFVAGSALLGGGGLGSLGAAVGLG